MLDSALVPVCQSRLLNRVITLCHHDEINGTVYLKVAEYVKLHDENNAEKHKHDYELLQCSIRIIGKVHREEINALHIRPNAACDNNIHNI